ncbi:MAG: ArsR family transcriptional regulator [Proteobacteria bacterium]|nr:ArsR family transcriptional regulator [Pseudomonadota bacterium]
MPRPARLQIKSPAAWRAILSPVRREIVEAMQELGPCPIADVAAASGRPADALYRHVSILVKAGFLVDAGTRKGKRNPERLYDAAANDFLAPNVRRAGAADERQMIAATAEALAKATARAMRASAIAGRLECDAAARNFAVTHYLTWLTPSRFEEVRTLLLRINAIVEAGRREQVGELYESLAILTPVTRARGTHARPTPKTATGPRTTKKNAAPRRARKKNAP